MLGTLGHSGQFLIELNEHDCRHTGLPISHPRLKFNKGSHEKETKQTLAAITVILTLVRLCAKDWIIFQSKLEQKLDNEIFNLSSRCIQMW